jgi:hypothetical protein
MSDREQANIDRINQLSRLHRHREGGSKPEGRCLAFVIDRRYLEEPEEEGGGELRLGVSFGDNVVTPETKQGILPIPARPGKFVFGVHLLCIKGNRLAFCDVWVDALEAGADCTDAALGRRAARSILETMSDSEYFDLVRSSREDKRPLKVASLYLLEDFELVEPEEL